MSGLECYGTPLYQWAQRHAITPSALADLLTLLGLGEPSMSYRQSDDGDESAVVAARRLAAARCGARLWRNNNGATQDETGRVIRFGLGNDSPRINKIMKSSDLIGITPVVCQCGRRYGIFTAEECKRPGWKYTGTEREQAQLNFINLVVSLGGIGRFTTGE